MTLPPPPPPKGPNPHRAPLPKGNPVADAPTILPPKAPDPEPGPTRPQFKTQTPTIMGPSEAVPVTAAESEAKGYSNREASEIAWLKESIWRYENRPRGRSSQATLGPSEIGSKCERKLVYRLQGWKPFTQGQSDSGNWPAIVGTSIHAYMEQMLAWLDQDRGRYLIEHSVEIVDGEMTGHLDVYDRLTQRVRDWKFPGARAVRRYKLEGIGEQYRTQGQVYAYGLARQGENPKDIAVTMIARDATSVDQGVHTEIFDYKPSEARAAVDKFKRLKALADTDGVHPLDVEAHISTLCGWCSYHAPGVKDACAGRQ